LKSGGSVGLATWTREENDESNRKQLRDGISHKL
jgi:hypothetical protein